MKKLLIFGVVVLMVVIVIFGSSYKQTNSEYLRIHIRANSNAEIDQRVKYEIKDSVVQVLTPLIADCKSFDEIKLIISENLGLIDSIANNILKNKNFKYTAKSKIDNENFPTRNYGDYVLEAGFYDALIVELGEAKGDNWWCVVYPPLCFVSATSGTNVVYRSRILDMINNFFK